MQKEWVGCIPTRCFSWRHLQAYQPAYWSRCPAAAPPFQTEYDIQEIRDTTNPRLVSREEKGIKKRQSSLLTERAERMPFALYSLPLSERRLTPSTPVSKRRHGPDRLALVDSSSQPLELQYSSPFHLSETGTAIHVHRKTTGERYFTQFERISMMVSYEHAKPQPNQMHLPEARGTPKPPPPP